MGVPNRIVSLLEYCQFPRLFIQLSNSSCVSIRHNNFPIPGTCWGFLESFIYGSIVLILQNTSFVSIVKGILKVFRNFLFTEFLFNSVDYCHYSLDVSVKHVPLLETLEWNCLVYRQLWLLLVDSGWNGPSRLIFNVDLLLIQRDNVPLLWREISRSSLSLLHTLNVINWVQGVVDSFDQGCLFARHFSTHLVLASTLKPLWFLFCVGLNGFVFSCRP